MSGEIFARVLDMSLTGSAVILAVLLARLLLKKAPKIFSYVLWGIVLIRLLCPVSVRAALSVLPQTPSVAQEYTLAEEDISPAQAGIAAYRAVGDVLNGGLGVQHIPTTAIGPEGNTHYVTSSWWEVWVLSGQYLWAAGMAGMALYGGVSLWRLKRKLRVSVPVEKNVFQADDISSPFVLGLVRPRIYLPLGLTAQEQEYILLHERHHIHRGDPVFKALSFLALTIHWFNPLVWLAFCLACQDMEMSCDEGVIRKLEPQARGDYAATLLSFATGRRPIMGAPLAFGEGDPAGRIRNLSQWKKPAVWVLVLGAAACLILGLTLLTDPADKEPRELYLLPVQGESSSEILTREEVQNYLDQIAPGIEEGSREGLFYSQNLPEEGAQARYGIYKAPQHHGSGFTVTLNVITVYEGETEKALLAWVEDTPGQLEDYIVTPYAYIGMDDFVLAQESGDTQLTLGMGYSVAIPQGKVSKERLTAVGYALNGDGYYTATAHIYNYPASVFQGAGQYGTTIAIKGDYSRYCESPDEIEYLEPLYVLSTVPAAENVPELLKEERQGTWVTYYFGAADPLEEITLRPQTLIIRQETIPREVSVRTGAQEDIPFEITEILVDKAEGADDEYNVTLEIQSETGEYPAFPSLMTGQDVYPGSLTYFMENGEDRPKQYSISYKVQAGSEEEALPGGAVMTYDQQLRFIVVEKDVYEAEIDFSLSS